jgi:hypothetical protein
LTDRVLLAALDLDDEDLLQIIMPPESLVLVWRQIDLDIDRGVKQLRECLGKRLELGGGPFGIPYKQSEVAILFQTHGDKSNCSS